LRFVPVKTPWVFRRFYPDYVWHINTQEKILYLTFDDGPTPDITEFVLSQLEEYRAKATFFCIGANVQKYPKIFNRIIAQGHTLGNHTMNHIRGYKFNVQDYLDEVQKAHSTFEAALPKGEKFDKFRSNYPKLQLDTQGSVSNSFLRNGLGGQATSRLFRPPYGQIKKAQGKKLMGLRYNIIMWDVLSFDWSAHVSEKKCLHYVISNSKPGSIIVFHDSLKASRNMMYALPEVLEYFSERGYRFEAL